MSNIFFWANGTCSSGNCTPKSPLATITPSDTSIIESKFFIASLSSIFAIILMLLSTSAFTSVISEAFLTNETATISTPIFLPYAKSSLSFNVIAETESLESGKATP